MIVIVTSLYNNYSTTPVMFLKYIAGLKSQQIPFEMVVVDDKSEDESLSVLLKSGLPIQTVIQNTKNLGLTRSLVRAIDWIKSNIPNCEYVVPHDADDVSSPDRLKTQWMYMNKNRVDVVFSSFKVCDINGKFLQQKDILTAHKDISETLPKRNIFCHSTTMVRWRVFDSLRYQRKHVNAQDYGLWIECLKHGFVFGGIDQPLVTRCKHDRSFGTRKKSNQRRTAKRIRAEYRKWLKRK